MHTLVHSVVVNYAWLARDACLSGALLYNIVPKVHYFVHMGEIASMINPRFLRTYVEESMIGRITAIYGGSKHGPYHATVQRTTLLKYLVGLELAYSWFG